MKSLNHQGDPPASEFPPKVRHFLVPMWYRQLRIKARDHIESSAAPVLSLASKPDIATQWRVRQQIFAKMGNEVDTFGMIETVMDGEEGVQSDDGQESTDDDCNFQIFFVSLTENYYACPNCKLFA